MPSIAADKKRQDKEQQKSKQKQVSSTFSPESVASSVPLLSPASMGCLQLTEALQAVQKDVKSAKQVRVRLQEDGSGDVDNQ
jgi:hypothetical protein